MEQGRTTSLLLKLIHRIAW